MTNQETKAAVRAAIACELAGEDAIDMTCYTADGAVLLVQVAIPKSPSPGLAMVLARTLATLQALTGCGTAEPEYLDFPARLVLQLQLRLPS
jgi:hypothetical protein